MTFHAEIIYPDETEALADMLLDSTHIWNSKTSWAARYFRTIPTMDDWDKHNPLHGIDSASRLREALTRADLDEQTTGALNTALALVHYRDTDYHTALQHLSGLRNDGKWPSVEPYRIRAQLIEALAQTETGQRGNARELRDSLARTHLSADPRTR